MILIFFGTDVKQYHKTKHLLSNDPSVKALFCDAAVAESAVM
jgi:hypothetical protein